MMMGYSNTIDALGRSNSRVLVQMAALGLLATSVFACASTGQSRVAAKPPASGPITADYQTSNGEPGQPGLNRVEQALATSNTPGVARLSGHRRRAGGAIQQLSYAAPAKTAVLPAGMRIETCPPEVRVPAAVMGPCGPGMTVCDAADCESRKHFPDEYLCDGGDREQPVHYTGADRAGFDSEDTIAEFSDHHGENRVKVSNKVCIYSPRFAAVRTFSLPSEGAAVSELADVSGGTLGGAIRTHQGLGKAIQSDSSQNMRMRSRAGGVNTQDAALNLAQQTRLAEHEKLLNTFEDLAAVGPNRLDTAALARLNEGLQMAFTWSREQNPVAAVKLDLALEAVVESFPATIIGIDDKGSDKPGKLVLLKAADKSTAQPGEVVTFTIRYDNHGPNIVHDVRISDNLTARLEFIEGSATSDRAGKLITQDNGEGSQILTWEFDESLPAKSGGVVTFQARVR